MKFAIAGAGYIASIYARALQNSGAQVRAVVEKYSDKSAAFASQFEIKRQYTTVEELLWDGDVDDTGVILVTWDNGALSYIETG